MEDWRAVKAGYVSSDGLQTVRRYDDVYQGISDSTFPYIAQRAQAPKVSP